jgi:integrase/recombinase XerD
MATRHRGATAASPAGSEGAIVRSEKDGVLRHVESYFRDHLQRARGASTHTVRAYGHALRLFLLFLAQRTRRPIARLELDDFRVEAVLAFLDYLESSRSNTPATRNCRLAAIHGFVEHLLRSDVTRGGQYERILAVRAKRTRGRVIAYLEAEQVRAILAEPDRRTPAGIRDYALLLLLFNTGARIAEILALTVHDLHVGGRRQLRVRGKGNKDRICPLWPETAAAVHDLVRRAGLHEGALFRNARGGVLSRDGAAYVLDRYTKSAAAHVPELRRRRVTPHVLRHSCAVALLQAGVDPTVIRDYLGHASVATTNRYITSNTAMKRDALAAFWKRAGLTSGAATRTRWRPKPGVLEFLSSL